MEKRMNAEMLLQYAQHPNRDLRKTYQERIVTELLRVNKGVLSTDDLIFDTEFSETDFFEMLSQKAYATFGTAIKKWNIYFEIIRRIGQEKPIVIKKVIGLYKKLPLIG